MIRISVLFLSYNQAHFIKEAVDSILKQQVTEPIEIIFSDDASTDATFQVISQLVSDYQGIHHIKLRQNKVNVGIGEHYNQVIAESRGRLLITAAGDDISFPYRVQKILDTWTASNESLDLIASYLIDMDSSGVNVGLIAVDDLSQWKTPEAWIRQRPYVIGASHAFSRRIYDYFGAFTKDLKYEDQVITFRSMFLGGGATIAEPLLRYRQGGISDTDKLKSKKIHRLYKKYTHQVAWLDQLQKDLLLIDRFDLWAERLSDLKNRSRFMIDIISDDEFSKRCSRLKNIKSSNFFWHIAQIVRVSILSK
jgi:glycosyltransferase involved in cell wall biosynthesis